ncbi:MAG: VWA domain-containing protein [Gammaproteobacteria bacterium]|nr:VWA domain-containing protein [Gammaproteobacteria bacterium]
MNIYRQQLSRLLVSASLVTATLLVPFSISANDVVTFDNGQSSVQSTDRLAQRIVIPRIQLAILLDTSNSMDGLIDQARNQLWAAVNEFSSSTHNGIRPILEVALFEYGNSNLIGQNGYVRQVLGFTQELDQVSEALFALTTDGGSEYCGYVINEAVTELYWSDSNHDIKSIFIAGNEPFNQGPVAYQSAIRSAIEKGVTVNTIFAGQHGDSASSGWQRGALLAQGDYMSINHNHQIVHIDAPQDDQLVRLNQQLNDTYIPYGIEGAQAIVRQEEQDKQSNEVSTGLLSQRIQSKASPMYRNENWDLVDALETGTTSLDRVEEESLPVEMKKMDKTERNNYVAHKAKERKALQEEIVKLTRERNQYVAEKRRQAAPSGVTTLNDAIISAVRDEAKKKRFVFEDN